MKKISYKKQQKIINLRKSGFSIPEISSVVNISKTTVQRYVRTVIVPERELLLLKVKQGGSKKRAEILRDKVEKEALRAVSSVSDRDSFFLLLGLYWGEGAKKDLSMINSDPLLIQSFLFCLRKIGVNNERVSVSLRVHKGVSIVRAKTFWASVTNKEIGAIRSVEVIEGKKKGRLQNGMCRVRIRSGIKERLLIQKSIEIIGKRFTKG